MTAQDTPAASGGMTITTGSTDFLAPDGTSGSITKYVGGAASGTTQNAYYSGGQVTASASGVHTFSLFVKRGATNPLNFCAISFVLFTGASGTATSYFNLASGTAITAGASVQDYGNGWYRLSTAPYTLAAADLSGQVSFNMAATSGSLSFATSGALNLTAYTWGAQLETGSVATSYIPTTTGTGSRSADVISVSGAVSGSIGQTAGTAYVEIVAVSGTNSGRVLSLTESGAPTNNRIAFNIDSTNHRLDVIVRSNSSTQNGTIGSSAATLLANGVNKIAYAYDGVAGSNALAINGSVVANNSQTFAFVQALSRVNVAILESDLTVASNQRIRAVALYTTRLTNAELATLTAP